VISCQVFIDQNLYYISRLMTDRRVTPAPSVLKRVRMLGHFEDGWKLLLLPRRCPVHNDTMERSSIGFLPKPPSSQLETIPKASIGEEVGCLVIQAPADASADLKI